MSQLFARSLSQQLTADGSVSDSQGVSVLGLHGNGILLTSSNFLNSIIGAGIIGLPFALQECGFVAGMILLVGVAIVTDYTVRILVETGLRTGCTDYEGVAQYCFGKAGFFAVSLFMVFFAYGAMLAYLLIIGDTIPQAFDTIDSGNKIPFLHNRELVIALVAVGCVLPLSCLRRVESLAWTSSLSIVCDLVLITIVAIRAGAAASDPNLYPPNGITASTEPAPFSLVGNRVFAGIGVMSFAFVCHHSSFIVFQSLRNPTAKRWATVTHLSLGMAVVLSMIMSLTGYLNFFSSTDPDILNNFSKDDMTAAVSRLLLAFTMIFTYPMEHFVVRHTLIATLTRGRTDNAHSDWRLIYGLTALIWGSTFVIAEFTNELGFVLEFTGSIAGSMLGYILPVACYISVSPYGWVPVNQGEAGKTSDITLGVANPSTHGQYIEEDELLATSKRRCFRCSSCSGTALRHLAVPVMVGVWGVVVGVGGVVQAVSAIIA